MSSSKQRKVMEYQKRRYHTDPEYKRTLLERQKRYYQRTKSKCGVKVPDAAAVKTGQDEAGHLRATIHMLEGRTDPASVVALGVIYTELGILAMRHKH